MKQFYLLVLILIKVSISISQVPTISSFFPKQGPIGTLVTISGNNFGINPANNIVYFGAVRATVLSASSNSLNVTVPGGTTYQPITLSTNNLTAYSTEPFILTFGSVDTAFTTNSFEERVAFATGFSPNCIISGDLNEDGKSDAVVLTDLSAILSIFQNTSEIGTVSFANSMDYLTGLSPSRAKIEDLNGDGKPDIVVTNNNSSSISVFKNLNSNETIAFAQKVDFVVGSNPYGLAICDLDADGKPDLAIANQTSNSISILKNNGSSGIISFAPKIDYTIGTSMFDGTPFDVSIADLDGDGKPEVVSANYYSNTVSVLKNLSTIGVISFATKVDFLTGSHPSRISIGDLDGDGKLDLAVSNSGSSSVSLLRNTSTIGAVAFAPKLDYNTGSAPQSVSMGDLNGDGQIDLAIANQVSSTVSVLKNISKSGTILFAPKIDYPAGNALFSSLIADLDLDSRPDILVSNRSSNTFSLLKNQVGITLIIGPKLYINKGSVNIGDTQTITGKDFTNNETAKLSVSGPNGFSQSTTVVVSSDGSFVYSFASNTSMPSGIYSVLATDSISGKSSPVKSFQLTDNTPSTGYLKITSPAINISSKINSSIKIEWTDKPSHISTLIPNTSVVHAQYKIEYNRDNTGWQLIDIKTYAAFYQQVSTFPYDYTPTQTGAYLFRVTDMDDAANTDMSATVSVNNDPSGVVMNYDWDYSGNRPSEIPLGVSADGTARIYVKISKKAGNNKSISNVVLTVRDSSNLSITNASLLGKVYKATPTTLYNIEANNATLTSVSSNVVAFDGAVWFWYVAPEDFARTSSDNFLSTRYLNLVGTVTYSDNSTDPVSDKVEIVRAPLMFVHGIGGDETTWDNLYYNMNGSNRYFTKETDSRWKFRRALNMYPGASFKQNAQLLLTLTNSGFKIAADASESYNSNSFQYFLQQMRNKRYSCNRVDYIAHSMGGDMARTAINYYSSEYKPDEFVQRKFKNYGNGFINKLITLNTPHNGSPLPDLTIEKLSQNYAIQKLLQGGNDYSSTGYLIRSFFNTVSGTDQLDFNNPTEAFKNLRSGFNGVKFKISNVKNHLISGDIAFGGEDCLGIYNELKKDETIGLVAKMFAAIGANECIGVDDLFVPYGVTDFVENSDFVVPLSSQIPGKNTSSSGNDYSIYYGINSIHTSIYNSDKNPAVGQKVFDLLNAPISSVNFANSIAANPTSGLEVYRPALVNSTSEYIDTSKIFIAQPVRGSSFAVDSSVVISVKLKDTTNFKFLNLLFQNDIYTSSSNTDLQSFNIQVNPTFVNNQTIIATAVYDSSGTNIYYTDTLSVNIKIDSIINGFLVTPDVKYLNSGETYAPSYNLIHNTYISNVAISDTTLQIAIADPNVVTYSKSISSFIANDTGTTYAVISYKQFKDTLFFIIDTATLNLIALPVNLTAFAGQVEKGCNLLQWKAGGGLYSQFILQKSLPGQQWDQVTDVNSLPGSSLNTYTYRDSSSIIESLVYYRLLLINRDGTYKVSNTVLLRRSTISNIRVFPNPITKSEVFIDLGSFASAKTIMKVIDLSGKIVKSINPAIQGTNPVRLDLSGIKPSIYVLQIQQGGNVKTIKLVVLE